jgi:hypothetical protein
VSTAWVYRELRAIRARADARDVEAQIQAVADRLRRAREARRRCASGS